MTGNSQPFWGHFGIYFGDVPGLLLPQVLAAKNLLKSELQDHKCKLPMAPVQANIFFATKGSTASQFK